MKQKSVLSRISLLLVLVLAGTFSAIAQVVQVRGTVSSSDGEPLPGVSVQLIGSKTATATNIDGVYSISVPTNGSSKLSFSYIGYAPQQIALGQGQRECNVVLKETSEQLSNLVVVGYGTQKKANLTGSVASVNVNDLKDIQATNTATLLQGRMPGVTVSSFSAQPGSDGDVEIKIRGIGTFGNSNPLILIDGVEGSLSNIPVGDIESISVLKDAASAAIYGVRAANGVILVTTRRGETGRKELSYSGSVGIQKATVLPNYLPSWQWATLFNEENSLLGEEAIGRNYTPEMIEALKTGKDSEHFANTNWMDQVFRTAFMQNHHLTMSGGDKDSHYLASLGLTKQDGIMRGTNMLRNTFRLNADTKYLDLFTLGLLTSGSYQDVAEPQGGTWNIFNQIVDHTRPTIPVTYSNGKWGQYDGNPAFPNYITNPVEQTTFLSHEKRYRFDGKVYLDIEPIKNLHIRTNFSYLYYNTNYSAFDPTHKHYTAEGPVITSGIASLTDNRILQQQWINENVLSYNFSIGDSHNFSALIGQSNQWNGNSYLEARGENFLTNGTQVLDAAQSTASYGRREEATLRSLFGRINYNYLGRYMFEVNVRRDESSRIPSKNRIGYFPAVSAGWNIAEEAFMHDQNVVSMLKLRASWGKLGNQDIGYYPYAQTYLLGKNNYIWGDSKALGAALAAAANPDIKWETTTTTGAGLDMTLFNKLNVTFDWFNKDASDILLQLPISALVGVENAPFVNAAKVRNRGWELSAGYFDKFGEWTFGANFNISNVKNEILSVSNRKDWIKDWQINVSGNPIGAYYGYVANGLYTSQEEIDNDKVAFGSPRVGDIRFKDLDNDGAITDKDRTVIGNPFPEISYGLNVNAGFRGFDAAMFWQGIGNVDRVVMDYPTVGGGVTESMWNRFHPTANPTGLYPMLGNVAYNSLPSDFWVKSASYLRLKNLELGYTLPSKLVAKARMSKVRVYVSGQNVVTFTNVKNYDPEKYASDSRNSTYPNAKTFSLGVNLSL